VKWKPGYAKFDIAEPPLNLSLNYSSETMSRGALNHLGIEVRDTDEVLATKNRLAEAGLATRDEMHVDCCFALQDKVWSPILTATGGKFSRLRSATPNLSST
jgi:hypothetical protein